MKPLFALAIGTLFAAAAAADVGAPAKFSDALYQKFQHDRCLQCHQFNSRRSKGRSYGSHRSRYLCDNCHTQRITGLPRGEWMAPQGDRMDYTGMNARDTCYLIKRNTGSGDVNAKLRDHLLHDVRIRWALENGMTPMGQFPAVPGGYAAWVKDVKAWVDGGMLCE